MSCHSAPYIPVLRKPFPGVHCALTIGGAYESKEAEVYSVETIPLTSYLRSME